MIFFIYNHILIEQSVIKSEDLDRTLRSVASDLSLHRLPLSHKRAVHFYGLNRQGKCMHHLLYAY